MTKWDLSQECKGSSDKEITQCNTPHNHLNRKGTGQNLTLFYETNTEQNLEDTMLSEKSSPNNIQKNKIRTNKFNQGCERLVH